MAIKVAVNGFGRIGRSVLRAAKLIRKADFDFVIEKATTIEEINKVMKEATDNGMAGLVEYTTDPIVSADIKGNIHSAIFDAELTRAMDPNFIKISAWYDNEMGYACRVVDLILKMNELSKAAT